MFAYYDLDMLQTRNCKITEIIKANNSWMTLFPDKIYPALSFKCEVTDRGMNVNKLLMLMTRHLLRNSSGLQTVLCIKKCAICSSRFAFANHIIFRANFGCRT